MNQARNETRYFFLSHHKLSGSTQADFSISYQEDILGAASVVIGTFIALLSGIVVIF